MPLTISCPSCATKLKVPDQMAGKKVKCPKCATILTAPAEGAGEAAAAPPPRPAPPSQPARPAAPPVDELEPADDLEEEPQAPSRRRRPTEEEEPEERPAARRGRARDEAEEAADEGGPARKPKKKSKTGLIIGLVVGGVALVGICCCGVPLGWYFISNAMSKATKENYDKIQLGMTQSQVEEILGSGKTTNSLAVALFFAGVSGPNSASQIDHWSKAADQGRVYVWTKSDTTILVSYSSATGGKVNGKVILQSSGGARTVQEQWSNK